MPYSDPLARLVGVQWGGAPWLTVTMGGGNLPSFMNMSVPTKSGGSLIITTVNGTDPNPQFNEGTVIVTEDGGSTIIQSDYTIKAADLKAQIASDSGPKLNGFGVWTFVEPPVFAVPTLSTLTFLKLDTLLPNTPFIIRLNYEITPPATGSFAPGLQLITFKNSAIKAGVRLINLGPKAVSVVVPFRPDSASGSVDVSVNPKTLALSEI